MQPLSIVQGWAQPLDLHVPPGLALAFHDGSVHIVHRLSLQTMAIFYSSAAPRPVDEPALKRPRTTGPAVHFKAMQLSWTSLALVGIDNHGRVSAVLGVPRVRGLCLCVVWPLLQGEACGLRGLRRRWLRVASPHMWGSDASPTFPPHARQVPCVGLLPLTGTHPWPGRRTGASQHPLSHLLTHIYMCLHTCSHVHVPPTPQEITIGWEFRLLPCLGYCK